MNRSKKIVTLLLSIAMVSSLSAPVLAATPVSKTSAEQTEVLTVNNMAQSIRLLEKDLEAQGTSVIDGLREYKEYLAVQQNGASEEEFNKLQDLIDTLDSLANTYSAYKRGERAARGIYGPAIATVITYFQTKRYYVAAELLTHCYNNNTLDSHYTPSTPSLNIIKGSSQWQAIRRGTAKSGQGSFPENGSKDLYYAIHYFEWSTDHDHLKFSDRYDFAPGDYDGLTSVAVNTMYNAQKAGELVPFYTEFFDHFYS